MFLLQGPDFDHRTSSTQEPLNKWYPMAYDNRLSIMEGSNPMLKPFVNRGGKLLMGHGQGDTAE